MDLIALIEKTVVGLGFELVDIEQSPRGRVLRVFIDMPGKVGGVDVEDCALVSNQLSRVLAVENVDYDRLEVSSPGMDRVVKKESDFVRFAGQMIQIKLRIPHNNRRNFQGRLLGCEEGQVSLHLSADGKEENVTLAFNNIEKARLVPQFD